MSHTDHAFDVVQRNGDIQVVPIGFVPSFKLGMHRTDGATGHDEMAVVVFQLVAAHALQQTHVLPAQRGETRVNTVDQHGLVIATRGHACTRRGQ